MGRIASETRLLLAVQELPSLSTSHTLLWLVEDGNIGVGILPEFEEVLERFFRSRCVSRKREAARNFQILE
jgi:hypothetical protein